MLSFIPFYFSLPSSARSLYSRQLQCYAQLECSCWIRQQYVTRIYFCILFPSGCIFTSVVFACNWHDCAQFSSMFSTNENAPFPSRPISSVCRLYQSARYSHDFRLSTTANRKRAKRSTQTVSNIAIKRTNTGEIYSTPRRAKKRAFLLFSDIEITIG
jgi:hypothetical protein